MSPEISRTGSRWLSGRKERHVANKTYKTVDGLKCVRFVTIPRHRFLGWAQAPTREVTENTYIWKVCFLLIGGNRKASTQDRRCAWTDRPVGSGCLIWNFPDTPSEIESVHSRSQVHPRQDQDQKGSVVTSPVQWKMFCWPSYFNAA